jgi:hypothetical protein
MAEKTYTARQLAERFGVAGSTVRGWLLRGLFPSAELKKTELGDSYWIVPESALKDFEPPKPGPVPKSLPTTQKPATGAAGASNGDATGATKATKKGGKK